MISGIGVGAACVAAPIYVTELGEPEIRGTLGTFFQLQITIGFLLGYILGGTIDSFKVLALVSSVVPVIFLLTYSFMPESPIFLRLNSKTDQARESLQFFRGRDYDVDSELSKIVENQPAANNNGKFSDLYTNKATLKAMIIALALMFFQQMSGINAVLFNAVTIFQLSGSLLHPNVCTIICGVIQVGATYGATVLIDRLGRKMLLIISGGVTSLCLMILGAYFYMRQLEYDLNNFNFVPLICIAVYLIVFSIGFGPIPWMIAGDIFSPQVKSLACSISAAFNWILAFMVTKFFNSLQDLIGIGFTLVLFAIICFSSVVFTIFVIPETKGKTFQEVQDLLSGQPVNTYVANDE
ncbi:hypothetical protein FQA39_LY01127 [Lamprigera yunnana]|nr:hypothetical protein FQA39_LY01127 [Lamprigera yunnana]